MYENYSSHLDYVPIRQVERVRLPSQPPHTEPAPPPTQHPAERRQPLPHPTPGANRTVGLDRLFSFFPAESELFLCGLLFCLYLESRDLDFLILLGAYFYYSRGRSLL